MSDDMIPASDLLQQHLAMIQQQAQEAMTSAVRSECETRDIDPEEYNFDQRQMAFVKRDGDA